MPDFDLGHHGDREVGDGLIDLAVNVRLPVPPGLTVVVVHPDLEIETARARALLGTSVLLADAVRQWANLGALVHGLHVCDYALISRSLEDSIAEPRRAPLGRDDQRLVHRAAIDLGAGVLLSRR